MYLKSIEVHGFKSFANKLVFQFKGGITGIVGPNGSGKSNVADAVRWVLGEQSAKQLRGSKMEDIIFSGTETRHPLGFAYVAITFDNSDHSLPLEYDEVVVARRVYRSGESEYLINGSTCLLKDVKEMFFDTGIGKEGYSIIGQGQIDKILSGKPEDRRELFDEAAGIVKYKKRKAATVKNLDAERQNLLRVNDILSELEIQVGPLGKQSEKAKKYLAFREELKKKDIWMFIMDYEKINNDIEDLASKTTIAEKNLSEAGDAYGESRNNLDELDNKINSFFEDLEIKRNTVNNNKIKIEQLEGEVKVYKQQIESAKQNEEQFGNRVAQLKEQLEAANSEKNALTEQKEQNHKKLEACENEKVSAEDKINSIFTEINESETSIDELNQAVMNAMNESSELKSEQKKYETMLEQSAIKKAEMNQNLFRLKTETEQAKDNITEQEKEVARVNDEINVKRDSLNKIRFKLNENERLRRISETEFEEVQKTFHAVNSQINTLKNLAERYEGYGQSIKKVMEVKSSHPGIIGVVADIITVDKKYETAVETSLGGNIQNIVTDNEKTAKSMIEYLKKNRFGRATFLPLSDITADADYDKKLDNEKGVLGPVSDFVKTDDKYREIIKYLMGRFILVDNVDNALALARKYHHSLRIVTLEGEFLNVGGSLSGGAFKSSGNLLGRKRELDDLAKKLEATKSKIEAHKNNLAKFDIEHKTLVEDIRVKDEDLQKSQLDLNTKQMQYSQAIEQKELCDKAYEDAKQDGSQIESQKAQLQQSLEVIRTKLEQQTISSDECRKKIFVLNELLEEKKQQRSRMHDTINQLSLDRIALMQTDGFVQEKLERTDSTISQINEDINSVIQNKELTLDKISERENAIVAVKETINNLKDETKELDSLIIKNSEEREILIVKQKELQQQREKLADIRNSLEKEQIRLQNQNEKLQAQFMSLNQYMWNEYELTYRSALEYKTDDMISYSELKHETQDLKQKIKNLGDVNVNAIDEYTIVSERYNTMKTQHDDIVESEQRLLKFIDELEEKMRIQFVEKFDEIKEQYNIVFRELFGGGKGTLELTPDEDVLEAGISIIAQPPGKTLKSMSMLSGGEKALSAIAILFAIQNLKPSPFCLLDEIEAALDDSNVRRFAKYLNKLKAKTQYIVITHRQGTMEAADTLYGITMQEKGVSTLVSVDLVEQQLQKEVKK